MGTIQFLGLASGTDWNSVISQLMAIERRPVDALIRQRSRVDFNRSVMMQVYDRMGKLNSALSTLRFQGTFLSRKVESSNIARVSATADIGAAKGTYNVDISRLAQPGRAVSGLDGELFLKAANLAQAQTMGIGDLTPYGDFQATRALESTLIRSTQQAGQAGAAITAGDTITISGSLKDGTPVSGTFTFAGDGTDTLQRLATTIAQVFHGEIAASVGSNGELTFVETDPAVAGDVTFNTTVPPLGLQFHDNDYSGSTLTFGIGNNVAGAGATARRLVHSVSFTTGGALELNSATDLATLDQVLSGTLTVGDKIHITGAESDGSAIAATDFNYTGAPGGQTIADLVSTIASAFTSATATYENGKLVLTADATGGSSLSINLSFVDTPPTTTFELGTFSVAEPGRTAQAQMITTGSFTVEGTGEHLLSSTSGKAGQIRGTTTLLDPSNTLGSYGITSFDLFTIDVDDAAGSLGPVTITGLSGYSTVQDLVDAINTQIPAVTAQLIAVGSSYRLEIAANEGGRDIRAYDIAGGIVDKLIKAGATELDSTTNDLSNTFAATTATDDATILDWFRPANGGPAQRRYWTGDEGSSVSDLIGGVAINGTGGAFDPGLATVVTANSSELNTDQDMFTYVFGSNQVAQSPPQHIPALDPTLTLAQAGFAMTPENNTTNPVFHTNGFITINGVQISIGDVNTTTVNQVLAAINASGAGVSAYFDTANVRFYLRNNAAGPTAVTLGGGGDTSNFLTIAGLLPASGGVQVAGQSRGNVSQDIPLAQAGLTLPVTSGVFTINGTKLAIDAGVDSLNDVIKKINNSGAGVTALYDPVADRLTLAQKLDSGTTAARISAGDPSDTSNFLEAVQLTADTNAPRQVGSVRQTSEFTVNGVSFERNSNSVDDVIDKVTLSLNAVTDGPESITVNPDTQRIQDALVNFIVEYNTTMELINAKPLTRDERKKTAELTTDEANKMTAQEVDDYLKNREDLLTRQFLAGDNSARQITRRLQSLVTGLVRNDGPFQSVSQLGLTTSEVGGGPQAAATSMGRLLVLSSDKDAISQAVQSQADLQDAIQNKSDDLYTLFANMLTSQLTRSGTLDLSGGISVSQGLRFSVGDGTTSADVSFTPGTYSRTSILNTINSSLSTSGLSSSILAYYDAQNRFALRVTKTDGQAVLQLVDSSAGTDTLTGTLGLDAGLFLGPDPQVSGGVALRARDYISSITSSTGLITDRVKQDGSFDREISNYDETISQMEDRLTAYETSLRDKFARLETNLSTLQSQQSALEAALERWYAATSSSSS